MFQFAGFALHTYVFSMQSFRDPGINARLTAPPGLSQSATPFFASWRQDIPHTLLFAWQHWPTALLTELRNQTSLLSAHISDHRTKTSSKLLRSLTLFNRQSSSSISRVLYSSHFCDCSQNYRRSLHNNTPQPSQCCVIATIAHPPNCQRTKTPITGAFPGN